MFSQEWLIKIRKIHGFYGLEKFLFPPLTIEFKVHKDTHPLN